MEKQHTHAGDDGSELSCADPSKCVRATVDERIAAARVREGELGRTLSLTNVPAAMDALALAATGRVLAELAVELGMIDVDELRARVAEARPRLLNELLVASTAGRVVERV